MNRIGQQRSRAREARDAIPWRTDMRLHSRTARSSTWLVIAFLSAVSVAANGPPSAPKVSIVSPAAGMLVRLDQPTTLAAAVQAGGEPPSTRAEFAWDLIRASDGRAWALTHDPGMSRSNRSLLVAFGDISGVGEGEYWLMVRMRVPAKGDSPEATARETIPLRLAKDALSLLGVAPGVVIAGEENIVLHGVGFGREVEVRLLEAFNDAGCSSCPRPVNDLLFRIGTQCPATADSDGRAIKFAVPLSQRPGIYRVAIRQGKAILGGSVLRVVPRTIDRPAGRDPHLVAWPLVSGQTIRGVFLPAADPQRTFWDYHLYYFFATAGSRLSVFLRRLDTTRSWFHPDELDPEIAVATPKRYVPQYLHGTDDRPNDDLNASLTREPLLVTGPYVVVAATTKGAGRYELGFQLEYAPPLAKESRFVMATGLSRFALSGHPAVADVFLFDWVGAPFSGAPVRLKPEPDVPPLDFAGGLTARTSPWGFVTVTMQAPKDGAMPGLWFSAEQGDATYSPSMYGHDRKGIEARVRIGPAFWTSLDTLKEFDQATGEIQLSNVMIKRDPYAPR